MVAEAPATRILIARFPYQVVVAVGALDNQTVPSTGTAWASWVAVLCLVVEVPG